MLEILRIPLFLNLWLIQNPEDACSRGKLLDAYVMGFSGSEGVRFAVQYILPFAAKLTHFMGCDFRGAKFLFEHTREMLRRMGAIVE